jgi:hypothetical protein
VHFHVGLSHDSRTHEVYAVAEIWAYIRPMTRSARWLALLTVGTAALTASCASVRTDEYAAAMQPVTECRTGSRICREVNPQTGRVDTPYPVVSFYLNGHEDAREALRLIPYLY